VSAAAGLHTLGKTNQPRFALTDRVWPAKPGGADVCLWQDDNLAALSRNDRNVAARYYVAARGGSGHVNPANQIDYMRTSSVGGLQIDNPKGRWADFLNVFDPKRYRDWCYRGWYCCHYHGVKPETRGQVAAAFDAVKEREADVWVGLFREVVLYAQERDTAVLSSSAEADGTVRLRLGDRMDDALFDYPLTVKVRLPDGWKSAAATQAGATAPAVTREHDGAFCALVSVVPDRGEAVLRRREAP
jgi:hypothetical protein